MFSKCISKSISVKTHIKPVRIFKSVLLPAPLGPMMAVNSPHLNSPDTPFNIVFLAVKWNEPTLIVFYSFKFAQIKTCKKKQINNNRLH